MKLTSSRISPNLYFSCCLFFVWSSHIQNFRQSWHVFVTL